MIEFEERLLAKNDTLKVTPVALPFVYLKHETMQEYPGQGLHIHWIEVEGPLPEKWPTESYRRVFGEVEPKLDQTIVLFGSNLGNASSHDNNNLPIIVAGGGFRHGQHLAFDPKKHPPLCNLYVQFLNRLGAEVDEFGSSNGTIPGFELA